MTDSKSDIKVNTSLKEDCLTETSNNPISSTFFSERRDEWTEEEIEHYIAALREKPHKRFYISPKRWIMEQRLQTARTLLISTDMTLEQICKYCRISSITHFIILFHQYYDISPKLFRERYRKKRQ